MIHSDPIIFQDKNIVIACKAAGIPCIPDKKGTQSLLKTLEERLSCKLHPVNRIDRPVSGLVLFAQTGEAAAYYGKLFRSNQIVKKYIAVIPKGKIPVKSPLVHFLKRNPKLHKTKLRQSPEKGFKKSVLNYEHLGETNHYQVLIIKPETGRFHQIRAQLSAIGFPIKGDVKYGARRANKDRSIHLHAYQLSFKLKAEKEARIFTAELPDGPIWKNILKLVSNE